MKVSLKDVDRLSLGEGSMITKEWLESGDYLPEFLRDFHDQKDVFKAIQEVVEKSKEKGNHYVKDINFVAAQVYTIDFFLWFMAKHGYTLQRSIKDVEFADLEQWIKISKTRREGS